MHNACCTDAAAIFWASRGASVIAQGVASTSVPEIQYASFGRNALCKGPRAGGGRKNASIVSRDPSTNDPKTDDPT
jgi:hypothetical protein